MNRILLLVPLLMCLCSCTPSNQEYYHHAQLYLGNGDYESAAHLFSQLGEYEDAADYALYCAALNAIDHDQLSLARADMELVAPFKSSQRYLLYIDGLEAEADGRLEEALGIFQRLGSFEDSLTHVQSLQETIPQRDFAHARALMGASRWEQALDVLEALNGYGESAELAQRCREEITQSAYDQAMQLYESEQYTQAMAAFEALGDVLDAPARARICRGAMYDRLEEDYAAASMATAQELMERYAEMEDYFESPLRLRDLQERYTANLRLAAAAYTRPYVTFGSNGAAPLLWRVSLVEGSHAALLCQSSIHPAATCTDLDDPFTPNEEAAIVSFEHPRLVIDLDSYAFTQGSGTPEDPFR